MIPITKTPLDLLDDIYSIAYWMTGSEAESRELVNRTYLSAGTDTPEPELLKTFRECYIDRFGQQTDFCLNEKPCKTLGRLAATIKNRAADIKLSVLLSEISGLRHRDISDILEKPVETIRMWLYWGRKLLVYDDIQKASA
ncbi:MAG: RNA polymerase subunit sigma-24 [Chlorobium sp.]|uniref:RNA polymerase subunit sigma-24 n=1 Tax=Chlorobium sp. TaxID=1095 RepID=UPI0025C493CA|nr:RNA polymerase subunit sigma-24 [Chlorobium sp.]MCF8382359.1 RNA polymerase subunit sigma-24 [Chlorobium sp.]